MVVVVVVGEVAVVVVEAVEMLVLEIFVVL